MKAINASQVPLFVVYQILILSQAIAYFQDNLLIGDRKSVV